MKETDHEIEELTNEIKHDIEVYLGTGQYLLGGLGPVHFKFSV